MIVILDYGSGNLRSAERAFQTSGEKVLVTSDYETALNAEGLVVPGVGAFGACMSGLKKIRGEKLIRERSIKNLPVLGICVGMQILFQTGIEGGSHEGVGILPGRVDKLRAKILPHMGWNTVSVSGSSNLFKGIENERFYFVHSYALIESDLKVKAKTDYQGEFVSAIEVGAISATQFHPEKSGEAGIQLISNWVKSL